MPTPSDLRPAYIIDTSSLCRLSSSSNRAWAVITKLIEEGRLNTVEQVMQELRNVDPGGYAKLKPYRQEAVLRVTPALFRAAGKVSEVHTTMSRPRHPNDSADPWLVAAAKLNGWTVVSEEKKKRRRIPVVCGREGISCITLEQLLEAEAPDDDLVQAFAARNLPAASVDPVTEESLPE